MADDGSPDQPLESREPTLEDLCTLCRELNQRGAKYIVIGGFAVRAAGYNRRTMDVDLMVAGDEENQRRVLDALSTLPDRAAAELQPGELKLYSVVRIADEIIVDLLTTAGGIDYEAALGEVDVREVGGVSIPFASPRLLWRMKRITHREKDAGDLVFLRYWFAERGQAPPE